jgi:hypothetical protein
MPPVSFTVAAAVATVTVIEARLRTDWHKKRKQDRAGGEQRTWIG